MLLHGNSTIYIILNRTDICTSFRIANFKYKQNHKKKPREAEAGANSYSVQTKPRVSTIFSLSRVWRTYFYVRKCTCTFVVYWRSKSCISITCCRKTDNLIKSPASWLFCWWAIPSRCIARYNFVGWTDVFFCAKRKYFHESERAESERNIS